jgi:hypothetical protein
MMPKSTAFVKGSKARARSLAIQAEKVPAQALGALSRPAKQLGGKLTARERAANSQAMNKSGFIGGSIRPKNVVPQLELDCSDCLTAAPGQEKIAFGHFARDLLSR